MLVDGLAEGEEVPGHVVGEVGNAAAAVAVECRLVGIAKHIADPDSAVAVAALFHCGNLPD